MTDLAEYLQWKRDAAELAALRVEVVALRSECKRLKVKLNTARNRSNYYKAQLGIKKPKTKRAMIIELIEQGLRNCDIVAQGFTHISVERARRAYRDATNGK